MPLHSGITTVIDRKGHTVERGMSVLVTCVLGSLYRSALLPVTLHFPLCMASTPYIRQYVDLKDPALLP